MTLFIMSGEAERTGFELAVKKKNPTTLQVKSNHLFILSMDIYITKLLSNEEEINKCQAKLV